MNENFSYPMIGQPFPEIEVTTTMGDMKLPQDTDGKWFVLFSHPSAYTPVCTTEFMTFGDMAHEFEKLDTELIGLAVGAATPHMKWTEWIEEQYDVKIDFPIIADVLGDVSKRLGMLHGATGTNSVRSVFIVDDKGIIRTMLHYPQEAGRNIEEILRVLKALKYETEHNVSMPENWPNNKFFGDDVIVKPARTHQAAAEFEKEYKNNPDYDYRDWWFVTKKADHNE